MPTTFEALESALFSHFATAWAAAGSFPHEGGTITVPVRSENAAGGPAVAPWVELDIVWGDRVHTAGPKDTAVYEARGTLQVNCYVPTGWGTALAARMSDRVRSVWSSLAEPGFHVYATTPGRPLPSPPETFFGRHVDTRFLWISGDP